MTTRSDQKQPNKLRSLFTGIFIIVVFSGIGLLKFYKYGQAAADGKPSPNDWPAYGRDAGGSRYSPLAQINRQNINQLKLAWTYHTGAEEVKAVSSKNAAFESTPILVDGLLYLTTPYNRVIALDPATGKERWTFDPAVALNRGYSELTSRGVSAWPAANYGRKASRRIFVATIDAGLIALDAATGKTILEFGETGQVDLSRDVRMVERGNYQVTSPGRAM